MLFLNVYPGKEKPFFLSIGSLKMTSCSNRKTLLSFALDGKPLSGSLTEKVSCCSSFPWAVILPWNSVTNIFIHCKSPWLTGNNQDLTSKPWSLPTFIISLQRFGTKHITSTALWRKKYDGGESVSGNINLWYADGAAVSSRRRGSSAEIVRSFSFCVYF